MKDEVEKMSIFVRLGLLLLFAAQPLRAEPAIYLEKQTSTRELSASLSADSHRLKYGDVIVLHGRFDIRAAPIRLFNPFDVAHAYPIAPSSEIRIFNANGAYITTASCYGFAGAIHEQEMWFLNPRSFIGFTTEIETIATAAVTPKSIPPGSYKFQLVAYQRLIASGFAKGPTEPLLYSNTIDIQIEGK